MAKENTTNKISNAEARAKYYHRVDPIQGEIFDEVYLPGEGAPNEQSQAVTRNRGNETRSEVDLPTRKVRATNQNRVLAIKRWQLVVGLCILIAVAITLTAGFGFQIDRHNDSIEELRAQTLQIEMQTITGQWQSWAPWGRCSVSCGTGLQNRERTCLNNNKKYEGLGCLGDSKDYRICSATNCLDGGWGSWTDWDTCSTTCGVGVTSRRRQCNNPEPSLFGKHCEGDAFEVKVCIKRACTDGGWSGWSRWDTCSTSCGVGMTYRRRQCNNPSPSWLGTHCDGDATEAKLCNIKPCEEVNVLFRARNVANTTLSRGQTLVFQTVDENEGAGYNSTTGVFTAPVYGAYIFTIQLCVASDNNLSLRFDVNNYFKHKIALTGDQNGCGTGTTIQTLKMYDMVKIRCMSADGRLYKLYYRWNMFSGVHI